MGRYEEAHQICERAKEKTPESAELYLQEGYIYLEEKEIDKAKESWKVAIRCAPEAETLIRIGNYYLNCNMLENARMCLEEAKRLEPEHPSIDIRLASLCLIQQDYKGFEKYNQLLDPPLNLRDVQKPWLWIVSMGACERKSINLYRKSMNSRMRIRMKTRMKMKMKMNIRMKKKMIKTQY